MMKAGADSRSSHLHPNSGEGSGDPISKENALAALEKIRQSQTFAGAERLIQFLDYIVTAVLQGQGSGLKETVIGVGLYHRDPGYDPKQDSIVRTQASRLRERLEEYYREEGAQDAIRIRLSKGSYAPVFVVQEPTGPETVTTDGAVESSSGVASHFPGSVRSTGLRAALGAAAVGIALVAAHWLLFPPALEVTGYTRLTHDGKPKWLVGTDGVRLFIGTGNFSAPGLAQVAATGGETAQILDPAGGLLPLGLSPAGDKLLLSEYDPGNLWSLDLISGSRHRLGQAVGPEAAWSPDGKTLAFCRDTSIWLAASDGTGSRRLATIPSRRLYGPQWSPDGSKLRVSVWETIPETSSIWEVQVAGGATRRLLPERRSPPNEPRGRWFADGSYYVFESAGQIWALKDASLFEKLSRPVQITNNPMRLRTPLPSPDGKKLFVVGQTERGALIRYDSASGQWQTWLSGISAEYVAISRDRNWIAYVTYPEGHLWRCRRDGSAKMRLSDPSLQIGRPEWSPDGTRIAAYGKSEQSPVLQTYIFYTDGSPPQVLSELPGRLHHPSWFPDGKRIVVHTDQYPRPMEVQVRDLETGKLGTIAGSQDTYSPVVSPDGKQMVAIRRHPISLVLHNFETGQWKELARVTGGFPNWSHDGRYIYFLQFPTVPAILRIRVSDGAMEIVARLDNIQLTGYLGCWLGLTDDDSPLVLRDFGTQDVYALDLKQ